MMKPSRRFARSKAFSLLETMVALLVTVICLSLLSSSLKLFTLFEKDRHDPNELVFSYVQFAKFLKKDSQRTYIDLENSNPLKIMFIKEEKKGEEKIDKAGYVLEMDNGGNNLRVRRSGPDGGNMTLLPIWGATFTARDGLMEVHINEKGKGQFYILKSTRHRKKKRRLRKRLKIRKQARLNQQRGSALLTSVLLLATTILLIDSYLDAYQHVIKINQLLANYLWGG
jgi:competence protein ComGF